MPAASSRRAFLRQSVAAALATIEGVTWYEGTIPGTAGSNVGAWRTGSVHFDPLMPANAATSNAPAARPRKEVGSMIALVRVRIEVAAGGDIDEVIGVLEDRIDAGLFEYVPSPNSWDDAKRRVLLKHILRADIAPAVVREADAPTAEIIVPLTINFIQEWK
jgi:hypothetical protein